MYRKRVVQIAAIVALTAFFLYLFLRNANFGDVWRHIKSTSLVWFGLGLVVNFGALLFRTFRWRTILDPDNPPPLYATFFATTVGFMLSTILPIRAADVARPALLSRRTNFRFSGALGTVLMERMLDLTSILLLFVTFAFLRWNQFSHNRWFVIVKTGAIAAAVILTAMILFILGLYFFREFVRRVHEGLGRILPHRFRESWMHFFDSFTETLQLATHRAGLAKVLLCTVGVWFCLTGQFWFATRALHRPLPFDASFFVTGVTTVGLAIPTPGGVGGFHKACQLVLTNFYAFDVDSSVAVALVFHVIGTLPVIVTGLILALREGLRWKDVTASGNGPQATGNDS
ncbi:MAG TPA: lysylphosphatidylglycerol synthase transmembrane domain-containing protein [Thermoanaerobaculia bacterium]|nr:lysylphosphatidylglycerol synthase transmembrane domain-containing protein [Thermoanaerobaculia bacterium]